ncbi:hypothetical protein FXO38_35829 [Capsicum annuum]|nr:hypothetical protein FXO38_35829 [Capsicum annuum]KAF3614297.1 hypothetical protein FXO37_35998 [Capsicum annuum]
MASGSSGGRSNNANSKGFDFASDDILCSYEDYSNNNNNNNQDPSNGTHSDPTIASNSTKLVIDSSLRCWPAGGSFKR